MVGCCFPKLTFLKFCTTHHHHNHSCWLPPPSHPIFTQLHTQSTHGRWTDQPHLQSLPHHAIGTSKLQTPNCFSIQVLYDISHGGMKSPTDGSEWTSIIGSLLFADLWENRSYSIFFNWDSLYKGIHTYARFLRFMQNRDSLGRTINWRCAASRWTGWTD